MVIKARGFPIALQIKSDKTNQSCHFDCYQLEHDFESVLF